MKKPYLRRDFLKSLGVSAAAAPFIPFLDRRAEAAGAFPTRLLLVTNGTGSVWDHFWPDGNDNTLAFRPGSITEPLAPFRSKLIFPKNIERQRSWLGGHESCLVVLWTGNKASAAGYGGAPSVDQIIANRLPAQTQFKSLQFSVRNQTTNTRLRTMIHAGSDSPIFPEASPYRMFDRLMLGGTPANFEQLKARRSGAIDLVRDELKRLTPQLDATDRRKLEQHLDGISSVQKRLLDAKPSVAKACGPSADIKLGLDYKANASFPEMLRMQSELIASSFACDLTRVASFQLAYCSTEMTYPWLNLKNGGAHHSISHLTDANSKNNIRIIETWYMQQFAYLLGRLDSIPEGSGTLLDNTMVIYANNLTDGAAHSCTPAIAIIAGKAGGKLKTSPQGRLLNLAGSDFTQILATACQAMGVPIDKVGNLGKQGAISSMLA
jgi:hypothetical protein